MLRLILGILVVPILTPLLLILAAAIGNRQAEPTVEDAAIISYIGAVIFGLPSIITLRMMGWKMPHQYAVSGVVVGLATYLTVYEILYRLAGRDRRRIRDRWHCPRQDRSFPASLFGLVRAERQKASRRLDARYRRGADRQRKLL